MQSPKKHTNRLVNETSPYLLQHAHNPVDWYVWGDEAFARAVAEDKPVLVSVGYSACHWCHVMERESFENEETARILNEHFISIKVDMEERADVDGVYMDFLQMTTGAGGYPMNVFVTPEKIPFFGGTYFPPVNRFNTPSFQRVLTSIADVWAHKREDLLESAHEVLSEMRRVGAMEMSGKPLGEDLADAAFRGLARYFDAANGGFGGAPKFPPAMVMEFLLRYYHRTGDAEALEMVTKTAEKMARGGIYDQLGGGFHRYSVDNVWLVPHFEKMLYENAQLARIYLHVFQATGDEFYKRIAAETLDYVKREMTGAAGGFYSAQDADSEGTEGKFFVWTPHEIEEILGAEDAQIFNFYYDVSEEGNFEEKNILHVSYAPDAAARALKMTTEKLRETLERGREKLFAEREKRVKPFRDEKVLTAWNGLMLATFAEAAAVLKRDDYLETAKKNADFILENLQTDGYLLRTWKDGKAKLNAYLEDYANFADGLIELFQVSGEAKYFREAKRLVDVMIAEFWDEDAGGFYFTARNHEALILRKKDFFDNAAPSGNSAAADVLLKLARLTGEKKHESRAATILRLAASLVSRYPQGFGRILSVLEFYLQPTKEIVVLGDSAELKNAIWSEYLPNKVVVTAQKAGENAELITLLEGRDLIDGKPTAFVCENFACQKPVTTVEDFRKQLGFNSLP